MARRASLPTTPIPLRLAEPAPVLPTESFRLSRAMLAILLLSSIDAMDFLDRGTGLRYLLLAIPFGAAATIRFRMPSTFVRRPAITDVLLGGLFVFGLVGTMVGLAFLGTSSGARPIFFPMSIAFLYLITLEEPTEEEAGRLLVALSWIGFLYVVMNALTNSGILPGLLEFKQYRNASFPYVALGIGATLMLRRRARTLVMVALACFIFLTYPAATTILVALAAVATLFISRPTASTVRPWIVGLVATGVLAIALANFSQSIALTNRYFDLVDKANANAGRLDLWTDGIQKFRASPVFGDAFSGDIVTVRDRDQRVLPYHNDFVLFLAEGGAIGLGLLVGWMIALNFLLLRRQRAFLVTGQETKAALLRALHVGFNAFFVAAGFNPVFPGLSRSATIFGLYAVAMSLGPGPPEGQPAASYEASIGALSGPPRPRIVSDPGRPRTPRRR